MSGTIGMALARFRQPALGPVIPTDGLILHYTMDNISGSTILDEMENYNATIYGATEVSGAVGNALYFDGNDYVVTNAPVGFLSNKEISIIAIADWKTSNVYFLYSDGSEGYECHIGGSAESIRILNDEGFYDGSLANYGNGEKLHISIYHGIPVRAYINNVEIPLVKSAAQTRSKSSQLNLGRRSTGYNTYGLVGWEDEVRVYNRHLTSSERQALTDEALT